MTTHSPLSYEWTRLDAFWPHLNPKEGLITRVRISDEESLLLIACALPDEEHAGWRLSLILGDRHLGKRGFLSCEVAQADAERILSDYLQRHHLLEFATSETIFDNPFHEVVAQMATALDDDVQISHITKYKREWVAVTIHLDQTHVQDYAFARESNGAIGQRTQWDRFEGYDLGDPRRRCVRATWIAAVCLPSPHEGEGIDVFKDPVSRWYFGIDSSFLAQEVASVIPNPFLYQMFLDITEGTPDEESEEADIGLSSAFLLPKRESDQPSGHECTTNVRFVGTATIQDAETGQDIELALFETGGLFAVETSFLRRGSRTVLNPFDESGNMTLDLAFRDVARATERDEF